MKIWILHIVAAISALCCAAFIVAWVQSYPESQSKSINVGRHNHFLTSYHGDVLWRWVWPVVLPQDISIDRSRRMGYREEKWNPFPGFTWTVFYLDFSWLKAPSKRDARTYEFAGRYDIEFHCALPIALTAILPVFWLVIVPGRWRRRRRRIRLGQCLACGYDLRENKDFCPECGTSISVSADLPEAEHNA